MSLDFEEAQKLFPYVNGFYNFIVFTDRQTSFSQGNQATCNYQRKLMWQLAITNQVVNCLNKHHSLCQSARLLVKRVIWVKNKPICLGH